MQRPGARGRTAARRTAATGRRARRARRASGSRRGCCWPSSSSASCVANAPWRALGPQRARGCPPPPGRPASIAIGLKAPGGPGAAGQRTRREETAPSREVRRRIIDSNNREAPLVSHVAPGAAVGDGPELVSPWPRPDSHRRNFPLARDGRTRLVLAAAVAAMCRLNSPMHREAGPAVYATTARVFSCLLRCRFNFRLRTVGFRAPDLGKFRKSIFEWPAVGVVVPYDRFIRS